MRNQWLDSIRDGHRIRIPAVIGFSCLLFSGEAFPLVQPLQTFTRGADTCRLAPYITTHWDAVLGDTIGYGKDADGRDKLYPKDGFPFDTILKPAYNNYHQMKTSGTAVNIASTGDRFGFDMSSPFSLTSSPNLVADSIDRFAQLFRQIVVADSANYDPTTFLDILNYGDYLDSDFGLKENRPNVQILNNVVLWNPGGAVNGLATITFPPFWRKNKKYPIFLHGNGYGIRNLNTQYTKDRSLNDASYAAISRKLFASDTGGIMVIYVNNGGSEAQGVNEGILSNLKHFFKTVVPAFGGDTANIMVAGASRGGAEAAVWGALTESIHARTILSAVPPIKFGSTSKGSLSTFPGLSASTVALGSKSAWKIGYAGTQTQKAQAASKIIYGTDNLDSADSRSMYGIFQRAIVDSLNKKFLHFSYGSRDGYFPLGYFLQFDSMLTARGIKHSSHISYNLGHSSSFSYTHWIDEWTKVMNKEAAGPYNGKTRQFLFLKNLAPGSEPTSEGAFFLSDSWIDTIVKHRPGYFADGSAHSPDSLGFSATIPYLTVKNMPFEISLTGQRHKPWKIRARYENGYGEVFSAEGAFGDSAKTSQDGTNPDVAKELGSEFTLFRNLKFSDLDTLEWFFEYDGKEVPNRFTPYVNKDTVFQRALSFTVATEDTNGENAKNKYIRNGRGSVSNGVDQIHTLLFHPNDAAAFAGTFPDSVFLSKSWGNPIRFNLRSFLAVGSDTDARDSLRFDLRYQNGDYIPHGVMNRNEKADSGGIFTVDVMHVANGDHLLKASVSDGKGGVATKSFKAHLEN